MASLCSSNEKHNFNCVIIACVDFIKLPLKDILASRIKPVDLYKEIDSCPSLKLNGQCSLRSDQRKVCLVQPPDLPNYAEFDALQAHKEFMPLSEANTRMGEGTKSSRYGYWG